MTLLLWLEINLHLPTCQSKVGKVWEWIWDKVDLQVLEAVVWEAVAGLATNTILSVSLL